jgi:hypothetical protein
MNYPHSEITNVYFEVDTCTTWSIFTDNESLGLLTSESEIVYSGHEFRGLSWNCIVLLSSITREDTQHSSLSFCGIIIEIRLQTQNFQPKYMPSLLCWKIKAVKLSQSHKSCMSLSWLVLQFSSEFQGWLNMMVDVWLRSVSVYTN